MAIGASTGLERLPFTERPDFADPYPEGLAVGHLSVTGDATGGSIATTFLSDGGFLFRLELLSVIRGDTVDDAPNIITSHRWASSRSPAMNPQDYDLNWGLQRDAIGTFTVWDLAPSHLAMIRRFPMGRTEDVPLQLVVAINSPTNTDTITYDYNVVCSYWRKEALQRPGFLASFFEAPVVPRVPPFSS